MTRFFALVTLLAVFASPFLATRAGAQSTELAGHGFAPVNGTRFFYEVRGKGPALVLIHGGQLDSRMWDDQSDILAKQFIVIRYDVRGYGGSFQPDQLYSDADDLAGLLDYLKVKDTHVVGLSLGGRPRVGIGEEFIACFEDQAKRKCCARFVLDRPRGLAGIRLRQMRL